MGGGHRFLGMITHHLFFFGKYPWWLSKGYNLVFRLKLQPCYSGLVGLDLAKHGAAVVTLGVSSAYARREEVGRWASHANGGPRALRGWGNPGVWTLSSAGDQCPKKGIVFGWDQDRSLEEFEDSASMSCVRMFVHNIAFCSEALQPNHWKKYFAG